MDNGRFFYNKERKLKEEAMEKTIRIFVACASGAGIGSLVALQFISQLWWLGMLAGGLAGYILYDPKAVGLAVKTVWARETPPKSLEDSLTLSFLSLFSCLTTTAAPFGVFCWYRYQYQSNSWSLLSDETSLIVMLFLVAWLVIGVISATFIDDYLDDLPKEKQLYGDRKEIRRWLIFKWMFFLSFYFYWLPKGIFFFFWRLPGVIWAILKATGRFAKTVFILTYSSERLLCLVWAAGGVAVFHFTGNNIFLGMLAGGALGVANYEILSVRLLKLVSR